MGPVASHKTADWPLAEDIGLFISTEVKPFSEASKLSVTVTVQFPNGVSTTVIH